MSVIDGDVLRVTCNFELGDGTQYQNIYHYVRDGTDPYSDASHVSTILTRVNVMYATLEDLTKSDVVEQLGYVDRIAYNEITDAWEVVENIGTFTPTFVPIGGAPAMPHMSSPYVIFKTARPRSVGKKFLFPFIETAQDDTILTAGAVTDIVAYGVAALVVGTLGGDATLTPCIVRTGVQTVLNLLVAVVGDVLGSQKRRRPGVGA